MDTRQADAKVAAGFPSHKQHGPKQSRDIRTYLFSAFHSAAAHLLLLTGCSDIYLYQLISVCVSISGYF